MTLLGNTDKRTVSTVITCVSVDLLDKGITVVTVIRFFRTFCVEVPKHTDLELRVIHQERYELKDCSDPDQIKRPSTESVIL